MRNERETYARERAGLPIQKGPIRYRDLKALYLDNYAAKSKPWFESMLDHSVQQFGSAYVHTILPEEVGRWLHALDLAPKTKHHVLGAMRQVLRAAVEWHYITQSPVRPGAIRSPWKSTTRKKVFPFESWVEVLKVADAAERYGPLVRFACSTGLRPEEWCALEWRDIDLEASVLHVLRVYVKGSLEDAGKTPGALRSVTLSKPAVRALQEMPRTLRGPIFTAPQGGYINLDNWRKRKWKDALLSAGAKDRPPSQMRHTFATLALSQGCTLDWIAEQLGHTNIQTTRQYYARYLKVVDERMISLLDQMEETDGRDLSVTS